MKTTTTLIATLALSMTTLVSCSDKENNNDESNSIFSKELTEMFPKATNVKWSTKGTHDVANFNSGGEIKTVWFSDDVDNNSQWQMTETEILMKDIPAAVKNAFEASVYSKAPWVADNEVDKLERVDMEVVYVIEAEQPTPETEVEIFYTVDGKLIKTEIEVDGVENDNSDELPIATLPQVITDFINTTYPGAKILDIDFEDNMFEIDIIVDGVVKEVVFNDKNQWVATETENVMHKDIPKPVLATLGRLSETTYADYNMDYGVDFIETPTTSFYVFEFEHKTTGEEVDLEIKSDGTEMK